MVALDEIVVAVPATPYRGIHPIRYLDHAIFLRARGRVQPPGQLGGRVPGKVLVRPRSSDRRRGWPMTGGRLCSRSHPELFA
jgi:hypothetical protein